MSMDRIPVLTLWRPWPELIFYYGKDVENRDWRTDYRGPLLIHAGKRYDNDAFSFARHIVDIRTALDTGAKAGAIVGIVELDEVCDPDDWLMHCPCGPWAIRSSPYHWRLRNPRRFLVPIECRGLQGLWYPTGEVAEAVETQLKVVS